MPLEYTEREVSVLSLPGTGCIQLSTRRLTVQPERLGIALRNSAGTGKSKQMVKGCEECFENLLANVAQAIPRD